MSHTHRLPPIQYLTAFVAAARHNSFKVAAETLNVSPSAISQQIKTLEKHIDLPLFNRQKRELQLTQAGESFYQIAKKTVKSYESGYANFIEQYFSSSIKVSMIHFVANEVVIPKLHDFHTKYPDLNLFVETSAKVENLEAGKLDAAIRFGTPPWEGCHAELITNVQINLLATKSYCAKHPINTMLDFQKQTLIHVRRDVNDWQRFMNYTNYQFKPHKELYFDSYDAGIRAAEEGLGIAMGTFPVSNNKIREGGLEVILSEYMPIKEAFYLVTPDNAYKRESYRLLLNWLKSIFGES